jgi:hypothetical protein
MSEAQASVVLSPVSPLGPESSITRTFTLSRRNPVVEIGRSSKREVKNRTPAKDNGWFDSRVMSRDHAELGFNMDKEKMIFIRDFGSTHGTWLNNVKLITGEITPLLSGDILRFGVDVDRGDEEFPALCVRCDVKWSEPTAGLKICLYEPSDMLCNHIAERAPSTLDTKPASELRPSSSSNTFCVPDDYESDMEGVKVNQTSPFEVGGGDITVLYDESSFDSSQASHENESAGDSDPHDSVCKEMSAHESSLIDYSAESNDEESNEEKSPHERSLVDYSADERSLINYSAESNDGESSEELDADASSFGHVSDDEEEVNYTLDLPRSTFDDDASGSGSDSAAESDADYEDEYSVGQDEDEEECIDPSMLTHKDNLAPPSLIETIQSPPTGCFFPKPYITSVQNQSMIFPSYFPLTPITPTLEHRREEDDGSRRLGRLSIRDVLNNYQDGPFAAPTDPTTKNESSEKELVTESPSLPTLKRKASELEPQGAQIPESILPPSETVDLETISQSQVAEAISSALSESSESEPPKKRVKATHDTSNKLASYTATAVISALLGGLGTIALLAALPAEYFQ